MISTINKQMTIKQAHTSECLFTFLVQIKRSLNHEVYRAMNAVESPFLTFRPVADSPVCMPIKKGSAAVP